MEMIKYIVCCALVFIVTVDVIVARPRRASSDMQALVEDIDNRLIHNDEVSSRRHRRHLMTANLALMEFCVQRRHQCRAEIARIRALRRRQENVVIVIEK